MKKLKEKLNAKLSKNGGFTLVEMLIVVAIIAILVVVSIPMVTGSLDNAKKAADDANLRAAIGAATVEYLSATKAATSNPAPESGIGTDGGSAYYVIKEGQGTLTGTAQTNGATGFDYGKSGDNAGKGIFIKVSATGKVQAKFGEMPN